MAAAEWAAAGVVAASLLSWLWLVLARGRFSGYSRKRGVRLGLVDLDWIYNSMPPKHGQIYPLLPLEAVEHF